MKPVSPYNSTPDQLEKYIKYLKKKICCCESKVITITEVSTSSSAGATNVVITLTVCGNVIPTTFNYFWDGIDENALYSEIVAYLNEFHSVYGTWSTVDSVNIVLASTDTNCPISINIFND